MLIWSCFFVCWALTLEYLCRLIKTTGFYGRRQTIGFSLSFGGLRRWNFSKEVLNSIVWDVFPLMMLDWKGIYDALRLWMTTPYILRCKDTLAEVNLSRDSRYFHQLFWIILSPVFSISSQIKLIVQIFWPSGQLQSRLRSNVSRTQSANNKEFGHFRICKGEAFI